MTVYVWKDSAWRDKKTGEIMDAPDRVCAPIIRSDLPAYFSVVSGKWVDGRTARREDLKRTGCRPLESDEGPKYCTTKKWAERLKMDWNNDPKAGRPKHLPADWSSTRIET